uniref:G-protein coupled receptors family 1 profile domain-containing protein n=1 Tax=Oryzias latipes TaxID=8090 RepID=A0A3B3I1D1_ORYLA
TFKFYTLHLCLCSFFLQIRKDHVAPVYVIGLLTSSLIQLCCFIALVAINDDKICKIFLQIHEYGLLVSVCFMVVISLERYLCVAWPVWYRFKRNIRTSAIVSVMIWIISAIIWCVDIFACESLILLACFLIIPFPLLIFFLCGTLKALSTVRSVSTEEKRRIIAILVLVLFTYTLLYLPEILAMTSKKLQCNVKFNLTAMSLFSLSPLTDLLLYIFMKKGIGDRILASLCSKVVQHIISASENSVNTQSGSPKETVDEGESTGEKM